MSSKNSVDIVHAFWDDVWAGGRLLSNQVVRAALEQWQRLTVGRHSAGLRANA